MNWLLSLWQRLMESLQDPQISNVTCDGACGGYNTLGILIPLVVVAFIVLVFVPGEKNE